MDYEEGDRIAAWTAATDFVVTLRWDSAGPHRDKLTAEFCGRGPVPVRVWLETPPERWSCGQRVTLLDGLAFRAAAVQRQKH
jgi:hypothetical protein